MNINVELTEEERDALSWILGAGMGLAIQMDMPRLAKAGIRVTNKLFVNSSDFTPYDENSFDPSNPRFPFKQVPSV